MNWSRSLLRAGFVTTALTLCSLASIAPSGGTRRAQRLNAATPNAGAAVTERSLDVAPKRSPLRSRLAGTAQTFPDCVAGAFTQVTPCGQVYRETPSTNGQLVYTIQNSSNFNEFYGLSCTRTGVVASCSVTSGITVNKNSSKQVTVNYSTGTSQGNGALKLNAEGANSGDVASGQNAINVPPPLAVLVTPDNLPAIATAGAANSYSFDVENIGTSDVTWTLSTFCSGVTSGCSAPASVFVPHFQHANVLVTYNAGVNDTGTVRLRATFSTTKDSGSINVSAPQYITVSTAMNTHDNQDLSRCEHNCFAATSTVSSVPYFSLGQPRQVSLVYHGDRVGVRPFIFADVTLQAGAPNPQEYWLQLKDSTGAFVPFLNGDATKIRFAGTAASPMRLVGQIDASHLPTAVHNFTLIVTAVFADHTEQFNPNFRLLIVNERKSPVARGWTIAGIPRLYPHADGGFLITRGNGSALVLWPTPWGPPGEESFIETTGSGASTRYTWRFPDSTKVWFANTGLADSIADRFGNTVRLEYDAQQRLTKIFDPIRTYNSGANRSYIALSYGTHGLSQIQEPGPSDGGPTGGRISVVTVQSDSTLTALADPGGGTTTFGYDTERRLSTVTDKRGGLTKYVYASDGSWKLARIELPAVSVDAGGGSTQLHTPIIAFKPWHTVGLPTTSTSVTPFNPPRADTVRASITDAGGHITLFTVDRWGQPLQITEPLGRVTTIKRSGVNAVSVTYPGGAKDSAAFNADGQPTYIAKAGQSPTTISYQAYGQVQQISGTGQATLQYFLGQRGHIDSTKVNGGLTHRFYADGRGRDTAVVDPANHRTRYHFDSRFGNPDSTIATGGQFVASKFDGYGRDSVRAASGQPSQTVLYDLLNRTRQLINNADATSTQYGYDSLYLVRVQDAAGNVYRNAVNALGWGTRRFDPADTLNRYIEYRYSPDGLITSYTNRRGERVDLQYDNLHRLTSKSGQNVTADSYAYDVAGKLVVGWNAVSRDSIFMDSTGWTDSVVTRVASQRFRRFHRKNAVAQVDSIAIATSAPIAFAPRTYLWNSAGTGIDEMRFNGRLIRLGRSAAELIRDTTVFPINLTQTVTGRTGTHQPKQVTFSSTAINTLLTRKYGFDSLGRIIQEHKPDGSNVKAREFSYDSHGRLGRAAVATITSCTRPPGVPEGEYAEVCDIPTAAYSERLGFEYSAIGDMVKSVDSISVTTVTGVYTSGGRLVTLGSTSYTVDLDGNRADKAAGGVTTQYTWSADGRLLTVARSGVTLSYAYNAFGRLIRRSRNGVAERHFLWDNDQLLAELDGSAQNRIGEYAYYPGTDRPAAMIVGSDTSLVRYFHQDELGNVTGLFANNLGLAQRLEYSAWGALRDSSGTLADTNRLRWKGLMWEGDITQLYYARARWYDPESKRFLTEDPVPGGAVSPYVFVGNDPVNGFDPSGMVGGGDPEADYQACELWVIFRAWYVNGKFSHVQILGFEKVCFNVRSRQWEGGGVTKSGKGVCEGAMPQPPEGVNLAANIALVREHFPWFHPPHAQWFKSQVNYGGPWDFKTRRDGDFESFGNWHYGLVGKAMGWPSTILYRAAGRAHRLEAESKGRRVDSLGHELMPGRAGGDDWHDRANIALGMEFWDKCVDQ